MYISPKHNLSTIRNLLRDSPKFGGRDIFYFPEINSTNTWLMSQKSIDGALCLAEKQSAGRGRQGKIWVAPESGSILLSMGLKLDTRFSSALSLVSGLALVGSLKEQGVTGLSLKWPNDVLLDHRKLAGILVEVSGTRCVLGIGVNVHIPALTGNAIDQPWTDLVSRGYRTDRDRLVASIVLHHERLLHEYLAVGFERLADEWNRCHAHANQSVRVLSAGKTIHGIALGVNHRGELLVEKDGAVIAVNSGRVSAAADFPQGGPQKT